MALKPGDISNFNTLKRAAKNGDLALMECVDTNSGDYRAVIVAANWEGDGAVVFAPLGNMAPGNAYEVYTPADEVAKSQITIPPDVTAQTVDLAAMLGHVDLANGLELVVDRYSLKTVAEALSRMADAKAAHVAENHQDTRTAKRWMKLSHALAQGIAVLAEGL